MKTEWATHSLATHSGAASFKAKHMTAGEGEFLGLNRDEASRRMADGRWQDPIPITGLTIAP